MKQRTLDWLDYVSARTSSSLPDKQGSHKEDGSAGCGALGAYVPGCVPAPAAALRLLFLFGAWLRGSGAIALVCGAGLEEEAGG